MAKEGVFGYEVMDVDEEEEVEWEKGKKMKGRECDKNKKRRNGESLTIPFLFFCLTNTVLSSFLRFSFS